jgi:uncharacterized protein (TIGR03435 family)
VSFAIPQVSTVSPGFEVTSVKASRDLGGQSAVERDKGWGDVTGRVNLIHIPLRYVLLHAYRLQGYQLTGPYWLNTECFDILATVPAGTPKERIPEMFQLMLAERFGLRFHKELRRSSIEALVVAEGGPKLQKGVAEGAQGAEWASRGAKLSGSGDTKSISGTASGPYGKVRITASPGLHLDFAGVTMDGLSSYLSQGFADQPIVNMTGLKGIYRVSLDIAFNDLPSQRAAPLADDGDPAQAVPVAHDPGTASLRESLRKMGLRLMRRNAPVEMFVIDHIDRTPTPN